MLVLFLACVAGSRDYESLWSLRAGFSETGGVPASAAAYARNPGTVPGDPSAMPEEASELVRAGDVSGAVALWRAGGTDLPATRNDLLGALVWFGRLRVVQRLSLGCVPPPDMADSRYPQHSGAVLDLGWMAPMPDGLFHPEFLLGPPDLALLGLSRRPGRSELDGLAEEALQR
jgi:hypothetical protein